MRNSVFSSGCISLVCFFPYIRYNQCRSKEIGIGQKVDRFDVYERQKIINRSLAWREHHHNEAVSQGVGRVQSSCRGYSCRFYDEGIEKHLSSPQRMETDMNITLLAELIEETTVNIVKRSPRPAATAAGCGVPHYPASVNMASMCVEGPGYGSRRARIRAYRTGHNTPA
ncbi:MAG: hypothetical protein K0Q73_2073 [Paenibacillus sp.]|jgi:hypothetical protein|nr:hypothetical protein [Paenibacillus sp.]